MAPEIDNETLRLLVAIDELGSVSAAARSQGLSQPAASGRVAAFEARWGLRVIHRSTRGSELTEDGLAVVSWARSVLREVDVMRSGVQALREGLRSGLAVAASLTVAEFIVPRWLGELHALRPDLRPNLSVVNSERVADLVRRGSADVGFIETAAVPADLASCVVGVDRLVIVVRPEHRWVRRSTPLSIESLAAAEFVVREAGSGTRSTFERALGHPVKVAAEASSTRALVGAAVAGLGPAVVSPKAVAAELETGRLVEVEHGLDLRRPLTAIWDGSTRLNDQTQLLLRIATRARRPQ